MQDNLDRVFAALADPTRRAMLARLATGDATVNQLAEPFDLSQPAISKHLKVLERAGLVSRSRAAQTRPCHLEPAALKDVAGWVEMYRRLWDDSFERLDAFLQATVPAVAPPSRRTASPGKPSIPKRGNRNVRKR